MSGKSPNLARPSIVVSIFFVLVAAALQAVISIVTEGDGSDLGLARLAIAGLAAAGTAMVVLRLLSFAVEPPTSRLLAWLQYGVGLIPALWVMLIVAHPGAPTPGSGAGATLTIIAVLGVVTGIVVVAANAKSRWQEASRARVTLVRTLADTSQLNILLSAAERERFASYREVIRNQVSQPLIELHDRATHSADQALADDIDGFQAAVMRPLAHLLHPVSVRVGLIPAVASLGRSFSLSASPMIASLDAQGNLLDKNVRLQVFRWVRNLSPRGATVSLVLTIDADHLRIAASGVQQARELDPIQQVAGLAVRKATSEGALELLAPMIGTEVQVESNSAGRSEALPRLQGNRWLLLTRPPTMDVYLVLLAGLVTMPFTLAILRSAQTAELVLTAFLSVVVPVMLAIPLTRIKVATGTRTGAMTVLAMWLGLGIAAGLANALAVSIIAPDVLTPILATTRLVGGVVRYSLIGVLILIARGYTAQALTDAISLKVRLSAAEADRASVLASADETDRFLSETLHRTVQGRLSAISLLLRLGRRSEAMHEFGVLCSQTLPTLEERLLSDASRNRTEVTSWRPGDVDFVVDDRIDWQQLDNRAPSIVPKFRLVIEECIINARRHGHGSEMTIHVVEGQHRLTLHCEDNGFGVDAQAPKGLGSRLFDEICADHLGEWSLQRSGERTMFVLSVQLAPPGGNEATLKVSPSGFAARPPAP
ncbi:MAG: hypothetical protein ACOYO9_07095 [Candidatus Nanopelagicales bacterium]